MDRRGNVFMHDILAGQLYEEEDEYVFKYNDGYLKNDKYMPISLNLPKRKKEYRSKTLFPFFDGLIPEGWLLNIVEKNWKLDPRDRMGLLLAVCGDCIGAVHIENANRNKEA